MSDVINRSDAIEAVCIAVCGGAREHCDGMTCSINKALMECETIQCKDCRYWWQVNELCTHENTLGSKGCCLEAKPDFFCGYAERR